MLGAGLGDVPGAGVAPGAGGAAPVGAGEARGVFGLACATSVTDPFLQPVVKATERTTIYPVDLTARAQDVRAILLYIKNIFSDCEVSRGAPEGQIIARFFALRREFFAALKGH